MRSAPKVRERSDQCRRPSAFSRPRRGRQDTGLRSGGRPCGGSRGHTRQAQARPSVQGQVRARHVRRGVSTPRQHGQMATYSMVSFRDGSDVFVRQSPPTMLRMIRSRILPASDICLGINFFGADLRARSCALIINPESCAMLPLKVFCFSVPPSHLMESPPVQDLIRTQGSNEYSMVRGSAVR